MSYIDLTTDSGFALLQTFENLDVPTDLDISALIEKQAYAEDYTFADPVNRRFSIASKDETEISARYAEKIASLPFDIMQNLNEATYIFGVRPIEQLPFGKVAHDQFGEYAIKEVEKYAGVQEYGTELDACLAARALLFPDYAEEFEKLASMKKEIEPSKMASIIADADAELGIDLPWMYKSVGTPEYAVYEKRASVTDVDLGSKKVSFQKLAEIGDCLTDMGIHIDFDAEDPYTTKLAIERLPLAVRKAISDVV
jgi:hypothetical protein